MRKFLPGYLLGSLVKAWPSSEVSIVQTMAIITVLFGSMAVATMYFSGDARGAVEACASRVACDYATFRLHMRSLLGFGFVACLSLVLLSSMAIVIFSRLNSGAGGSDE